MLFSTILETMTPYKSDLLKEAPSGLMNKSSIHQYASQRSERERERSLLKGDSCFPLKPPQFILCNR